MHLLNENDELKHDERHLLKILQTREQTYWELVDRRVLSYQRKVQAGLNEVAKKFDIVSTIHTYISMSIDGRCHVLASNLASYDYHVQLHYNTF